MEYFLLNRASILYSRHYCKPITHPNGFTFVYKIFLYKSIVWELKSVTKEALKKKYESNV